MCCLQAAASGALSNLCIENLNNQAAIAALGGIQQLTGTSHCCLVHLLSWLFCLSFT
jgi:hypothetical protein